MVARIWGLTGTPAPNGYLDLHGQFKILDGGAALGKYITHFRDQYFQVDYDGFTYNLMPGAEKRIEERIRPYVLRMSAEEYLELPPIVDDVRELEMEPAARKTYDTMKKDMLAELPEGIVTGANAAAVYSKCKQMANGAVYVGEPWSKRTVAHIHNTKLEALDELIEELAGQQLLIAYEFTHDLERLQAHFGGGISSLRGNKGEKTVSDCVARWNSGDIKLLACHPASAAHGLNLQYGGCGHVVWFSPIWDLELYQQFIRRIHRQGNDAQRIVNHLLCVKDTIDELALQALRDKDTTQARLLQSLNHEITGDERMAVQKLSRDGGSEAPRKTPPGWGKPKEAEPTDADVEALVRASHGQGEPVPRKTFGQRERIQQTIAPQNIQQGEDGEEQEAEQVSRATTARAAFSPALRQKLAEVTSGDVPGTVSSVSGPIQTDIEDHIPTGQRPAAVAQDAEEHPSPPKTTRRRATPPAASVEPLDRETTQLRVALLQLAGGDVEKAAEMLEFVTAST